MERDLYEIFTLSNNNSNYRICVATNLGSIFDGGSAEFSYYSGIVFSILYLSGVVVIATGLILDKLNILIREIIKNQ